MRYDSWLDALQAQGLLPPEQAAHIRKDERTRPFSIHYEVRALLYLGITMLAGGLGVLLYQHLDDIGHGVVITTMLLLMAACFGYAARHRTPFSWAEAPRQGFLPDYVLLLGCLLFLSLEGYVQYQYRLFGSRYGLAVFLPAVLFFWLAYRFDHRGVLTMAITALASWVGVSVAPLAAFTDYHLRSLSGAAISLGLLLTAVGLVSEYKKLKAHFSFTYLSLGSNLVLLAATASLFEFYPVPLLSPLVAVVLVLGMSGFLVWYARRTHSYLFLLMGALYSYIVISYLYFKLMDATNSDTTAFMVMLYFLLSTFGIVLLFINIKKILRITHEG
ncbi:DUF2157 domain-containing protein [Hymenobacter tibetensis]|uniref:DUF2157 domain-containing protein n=1 Tax=Hymenobacter tibetensis TaxID=497967 RepID=A0ABY4D2M4_9BACT|nr:DUF2157 domain-containing protein [Hymenobacter tibetensis]UOG75464.1 DUF2157 domain-containing protein [Hymenobacter tibetensis]